MTALWVHIWGVGLCAAGLTFALITLAVLFRGSRELRDMIRSLGEAERRKKAGAGAGATGSGS